LSLVQDVYPDPGLRPSNDMDLVVGADRRRDVDAIMADLGFVPILVVEDDDFEITYRKNTAVPAVIEISSGLHEITEYSGLVLPPVAEVVGRAGERNVGGCRFKIMAPEDELLFLVTHHLTTHFLRRLVWLCDLAEFIRKKSGQMDWARLVANARRLRQSAALHVATTLAREVTGVRIPEPAIAPSRAYRMLMKSYLGPEPLLLEAGRLEQRKDWLRLLLIDGMGARLRFALGRLAPDRRWLAKRYERMPLRHIYPLALAYHLGALAAKSVAAGRWGVRGRNPAALRNSGTEKA
jgi:hypothetical protein